jgi:hypothetical protein
MKTSALHPHNILRTPAKTTRTLIALTVLVSGNLFTFISPTFTTTTQKINTSLPFSKAIFFYHKVAPPFEKPISVNKEVFY